MSNRKGRVIKILIIGDVYNQFIEANSTANHLQLAVLLSIVLIIMLTIIAAIVSDDHTDLAIIFGLGAALTTIVMIGIGWQSSNQNLAVTKLSTQVIKQSFVKTHIATTNYQTVHHDDKTTYVINGKTYSINNPTAITKIDSAKNKTSKVELDTVRLKPLNDDQKRTLQKALNYNLQNNSSDALKSLTSALTSADYTPADYQRSHALNYFQLERGD